MEEPSFGARGLLTLCLTLVVSLTAPGATALAASVEDIDIPYERFVLDNGLTLLVHVDRKAPIAAVNVWYHVGSKDEKPGRTGFAHLFEHLMFNGSENFDDDYFKALDRLGATDTNGTTSADRTNYFQNVPNTALDVALWLESDRMGHLLGAVTQERLDEQRGVVKNEKRQSENQPYGKVFKTLGEMAFPAGHPYSWPTIGSMEDLDAASLEDVHAWFKEYYGPGNAVITVAGDVDPQEVLRLVERNFGDIPPGPPLQRRERWIAKRDGVRRRILEDRVPQARIIKAWNIPKVGTAGADYLNLVSDLIGAGKNSRLHKRLVHDEQIATDVAAFVWLREIAGLFVVWATAQPGQDLAVVERALDQEIGRFLDDGPSDDELERVKVEYRANFLRGSERIGGFGGKSDVLASSQVLEGSPDAYKKTLRRVRDATPRQVRGAARRWLSGGVSVLEVRPFEEGKAGPSLADRSKPPEPGTPPKPVFPALARAELSNGLGVVVVERHDVPLVRVDLHVDAGYAADSLGVPGTAALALDMLDEGTVDRDGLEISEELSRLGATLELKSNLDVSTVSLSALKENLAQSLEIFADVVLHPAFAEDAFERQRKQQLAKIAREKATPFQMALRVFPRVLYGADHPYGLPFTGSGDEASVAGMTPASLVRFHEKWFKPNNATLVVVGDTSLAEITPLLEASLAEWQPGEIAVKELSTVAPRDESIVYLIDRPGSSQSIVVAGHVAPPKANPDEVAIEAMNQVLGGSFSARMNMNLREDKHWSYGARTYFMDARGQRPFIVYAPVQTDKTKESMLEIRKELTEIQGKRPPTASELAIVKDKQTLTLPGRWETGKAIARSVAEVERFGFPDDYWNVYPNRVRELELSEVVSAADTVLHPDQLVWVIVGDAAKIEPGIRELGFGTIQRLDSDGNPVSE